MGWGKHQREEREGRQRFLKPAASAMVTALTEIGKHSEKSGQLSLVNPGLGIVTSL